VNISQKAAVSLLISTLTTAVFSFLAFAGLFNLVEARFFRPAVIRSLLRETASGARLVQVFLADMEWNFSETLNQDAVRRSFLPSPNAKDISDRGRVYGLLAESQKGLHSVRFVDAAGKHIYFSTDPSDILEADKERPRYLDYAGAALFTPYEPLAVPDQGKPKITLDQQNERVVFSLPFYDSLDVYRGTALHYLSSGALTDMLVRNGRLGAGEYLSLISSPPGIVTGLSPSNKESLLPVIESIWSKGLTGLSTLDSGSSVPSLILVSNKTEQGLFSGRVVEAQLFEFPLAMKLILLFSLALTVYLTVFLCFNLRTDSVTVIQARLKNLKFALIREYYERKEDTDWERWRRELEDRRREVQTELKQGIKEKYLTENIDLLIGKSWDELLAALGGRPETAAVVDEDKLKTMLNRLLAEGAVFSGPPPDGQTGAAPAAAAPVTAPAPVINAAEEPEELEELEELETLEEPEPAAPPPAEPEGAAAESAGAGAAEPFDLESEIAAAEADLAERPRKRSNVRLVFGDDDIPYIVESSGLELVDEEVSAMLNAPLAEKDETGGAEEVEEIEEAEELEELEELEEFEELEELEELEETGPVEAISFHEEIEPETDRRESNSPFAGLDDSEMIELEMFDPFPAAVPAGEDEKAAEPEEPEEPEELEEILPEDEGAEPAGIWGEAPAPPAGTASEGGIFDMEEMEEIARRIEFSGGGPEEEPEETGEDLDEELEIVSPFASMLSRVDGDGEMAAPETEAVQDSAPPSEAQLEELEDKGILLFYAPFQGGADRIPELPGAGDPAEIIREEGEMSFVGESAKIPNPETEQRLDPGLKNLVDSVIGKDQGIVSLL
jgi:hypothetical protein